MPPELLRDNSLSPSYNIYSYGIVLWELWTTEVPFEDTKELVHLIWRIYNNNDRPPIPDDCQKRISDLLVMCWETDWKNRAISYILSVVGFI